MSSSEGQPAKGRGGAGKVDLKATLLVHVARQLGPALDQVDITDPPESLKVRDLILEFTGPDGPTPTEIRGCLMDLIKEGYLTYTMANEDLIQADAKVYLRVRGLLAARRVDSGCGRSGSRVTLRMKPWKRYGVFGAWLDTGLRERESIINKPGLNLAAFYVLAVHQPTKASPLLLSDCPWQFARLAHLGVGVKSGPGARIMPSEHAISEALDRVSEIVPLVASQADDDKRRKQWHLKGAFPEVRVVGASGTQFRDWAWMHFNLGQALRGKPFPHKMHETVTPLTDDQCKELELETQRKHRRGKAGRSAQ